MTIDAAIYWMGWAAAAAALLMWYCEHRAHEHNLKKAGELYGRALQKLSKLKPEK